MSGTIRSWVIVLAAACFLSFLAFMPLPPQVFLAAAYFSFIIGNAELKKGGGLVDASAGGRPNPMMRQAAPTAPASATAAIQLPERPMLDQFPSDLKCPSCGANIKPTTKLCGYCGTSIIPLVELPEPKKLAALEVGKSVRVKHPQKGEVTYRVTGRILYTELWQATRGTNVPWTPTGNFFAGFALEPGGFLLNWQDRFYILDEKRGLTDMDINRDFAPHARTFAQSNQTSRVEFGYGGGRWLMVDIGRFAIEFEDGEGLHLHKGAIGRFIHAASGNQALVVDDFQSGGSGGQDTLLKGYLINETDITY